MTFLQLLLAHLIGDFFTQTQAGIEHKEEKKWKSSFLYVHILIHFALIILILWDLSAWKVALFISILHLIIDGAKLSLQTENTKRYWFYIDQFLHVAVLAIAWVLFFEGELFIEWGNDMWVVVTGFVLLTNPAGYTIQAIMSRWKDDLNDNDDESLSDAGKLIGIFERILIYVSILSGMPQAIGFLIAAKSVFRFGDLSRAKSRKLTEYILIGTLISFLFAVCTGLAVLHLR